ncbi:molecular chaperone GrpE [Thermosyntropha lipolytica DSM 11003]|uniref:Protein GrpE n=1 Tax=Thermosyntropha lipolytica DSM 11003 TaxID=1123382 RepID=A0A1M5N746_9FIRM|nr:nucleotide exchange factor GrpE [Thermosyntropha lipolytica]SHG85390.1 molecular chaperone GrpE [Thermosyntropha lipolytica DSM 11003]
MNFKMAEKEMNNEENIIKASEKDEAGVEIKEVEEEEKKDRETGTEGEETDELARCREELEAKKAEAQKYYELYLRALAELDNVKKRTAREREEYIKYASLPLMKKLLAVVDDLERALEASFANQDYQSLSKGLEMVVKKVYKIMEEEGVEPIAAVGKPFDPQFHEALAVEENADYPSDTVIEEMRKGYMMHGRIIRPSLVKVNKVD